MHIASARFRSPDGSLVQNAVRAVTKQTAIQTANKERGNLSTMFRRLTVIKQVDDDWLALPPAARVRNQREARQVADHAYPFRCCAVCGLQLAACLQLAHLDHDAANNAADNLARLCPTHHGMYDCGLYPLEALQLLQAHWQKTKGVPDHKPRMKEAGAKAALKRKRSATARKAVATRQANADRNST
jgi:hypothetical protein